MLIVAEVSSILWSSSLDFVRFSCFCFESKIFTPVIESELGKLIAFRCRSSPKVANFVTLLIPHLWSDAAVMFWAATAEYPPPVYRAGRVCPWAVWCRAGRHSASEPCEGRLTAALCRCCSLGGV